MLIFFDHGCPSTAEPELFIDNAQVLWKSPCPPAWISSLPLPMASACLGGIKAAQKLQKPFPWAGTYRPWWRHLSFFWINYIEFLALSKLSRLQIILAALLWILSNLSACSLNWGSKKRSVCSSNVLANASQSDNFSSHLSSVVSSFAAKDCCSASATRPDWEP